MPFRLEVERLKRVEADLAAARGAAQRLGKRRRSCAIKAICGVASRSGIEVDRLDRRCAPGRAGLLIRSTLNKNNIIPTIFLSVPPGATRMVIGDAS
jgi:hypothetical protein